MSDEVLDDVMIKGSCKGKADAISNKTNDFLCHIFHLTNFIFMFKPKNQGYLSKTFPRYHHPH